MDDAIRLNQQIGERIRDARMAKKMSQQELAAKANISLPHISDITGISGCDPQGQRTDSKPAVSE